MQGRNRGSGLASLSGLKVPLASGGCPGTPLPWLPKPPSPLYPLLFQADELQPGPSWEPQPQLLPSPGGLRKGTFPSTTDRPEARHRRRWKGTGLQTHEHDSLGGQGCQDPLPQTPHIGPHRPQPGLSLPAGRSGSSPRGLFQRLEGILHGGCFLAARDVSPHPLFHLRGFGAIGLTWWGGLEGSKPPPHLPHTPISSRTRNQGFLRSQEVALQEEAATHTDMGSSPGSPRRPPAWEPQGPDTRHLPG